MRIITSEAWPSTHASNVFPSAPLVTVSIHQRAEASPSWLAMATADAIPMQLLQRS
jgi:hypothetical protein